MLDLLLELLEYLIVNFDVRVVLPAHLVQPLLLLQTAKLLGRATRGLGLGRDLVQLLEGLRGGRARLLFPVRGPLLVLIVIISNGH